MKTGKLKGVSTVEAAGIIVHLGGQKLLYRDAPLLNESQIDFVLEEFKKEKCDSILFDSGAVFDATEYDLATKCAEAVKSKCGDDLKVVLYNVPHNV